MDGVLLIDKPSGPTSHDVVARIRRATRESRVGHTGTLDPRATGLLPLVLGRATRLASRFTGSAKTYDAEVRLGVSTDTDDGDGQPIGAEVESVPARGDIEAALDAFRGTFQQVPPDHSAKKQNGEKAYDRARRAQPMTLAPVAVTVQTLHCTACDGPLVWLHVTATAGFYVRSLARDLGRALGCGGHLRSLRRTRSGSFDVSDAVTLDEAERLGVDLAARVVSPADALGLLPAVTVTALGLTRVLHGNPLAPDHLAERWLPPPSAGEVRILGPDGRLLALAHSRGGALHPAVVLG